MPRSVAPRPETGFLADAGEMGALIGAFDWSRTSLGPLDTWPQSLRTAVDVVLHSPLPLVMLWGPEGIMIYNDAYSRFAGGRHPRLLGSPVLEGWPEVAEFNRRVMEVGLAGGTLSFHDQHLVLYRNDVAEDVWMDLNYSPIRDDSGRPAGVLAIVVESTERVRAEAALRGSEERFRALAEASSDVMYRMSPDWAEMWQLHGRDFIADTAEPSRRWLETYIHPDDQPRVMKAIDEAVRTKSIFALEHRVRRVDGTLGWTLSRAVPLLDRTGGVREWFGAASDVTARKEAEAALRELNETLERKVEERTQALEAEVAERRKAEAALQQAQKMEAIGQLTGGVAHDFNNLLTAVFGNLDQLERRLAGDDGALRLVRGAQRAAERGAKVTDQLLAFGRRQHLRPRAVDANIIIARMGDLLAHTLGGTVQVHTVLAPDLWPTLIDPTHIETALLNLAINARDAMPQGGTITLETANVGAGAADRPAEATQRDYVRITVRDTGVGMSEEVQAKAFDPFFTTKDVGKGSGLGLSQVYGLVRQSGGVIRLESRVGEGTTVRLYLPRAARPAAAAAESGLDVQDVPCGHVLLVDDDPDVRRATAEMLRQFGCDIAAVASGQAALDRLAQGELYDLMLVDIAMPGLNGVETVRRARQIRPRLPVLFMTGYAEPALAEKWGLDDPLIRKPFRFKELADTLRRVLRPVAGETESGPAPQRGDQ